MPISSQVAGQAQQDFEDVAHARFTQAFHRFSEASDGGSEPDRRQHRRDRSWNTTTKVLGICV